MDPITSSETTAEQTSKPDPGPKVCPRCRHSDEHDLSAGCLAFKRDGFGNLVFRTPNSRVGERCGCRELSEEARREAYRAQFSMCDCGHAGHLHPKAYAGGSMRACRGRARAGPEYGDSVTSRDCDCRCYRPAGGAGGYADVQVHLATYKVGGKYRE